jgi:YkoY family integral membrane protein
LRAPFKAYSKLVRSTQQYGRGARFPPYIVDFHASDLLTIGLLVLLEGLLSADNALVLAILVLGLPRDEQRKALRYGILGAFAFRGLATVFAAFMIQLSWVKLLGAIYLLYLPFQHFLHGDAESRRKPKPARPWLGLTAFWATVAKVELTDIVFAIDSILVAVAMSNKLWVIVTGGLLGIIAMRMLIGQLLVIVQRYPALVDGAFIIIAWVGIKLLIEYLHQIHVIGFEIPKWLSLGLIIVIFGIALLLARRHGPIDPDASHDDEAAELLMQGEEETEGNGTGSERMSAEKLSAEPGGEQGSLGRGR